MTYPAASWPYAYPSPEYAISAYVSPAVVVVASSASSPSVLQTATPHHFVTGDTAVVAGHVGSTPAIDGPYVVTVLDATHVSIPLAVTVAGAGGTITRTVRVEPLTLTEAKLRAGLDWMDGDVRDAQMLGYISAARSRVELDTGLGLLTQVRDVYADALNSVLRLPSQCAPLQEVTSVSTISTTNVTSIVDPANYTVDYAWARIGLASGGFWPTDLRPLQPWQIRVVAGYPAIAAIPPDLLHCVGVLTAHFATIGRDVTVATRFITEVPKTYDDLIRPWRRESVA